MIETKFRAWDGEKMIFRGLHDRNWYTDEKSGKAVKGTHPSDTHFLTVMQFIGVKGYNDECIYDGDKVKGRYYVQRSLNPDSAPQIIDFYGVVDFAEGCYYVKGDNGQCVFSFNYQDYEIEVIGNIHEN